MTPICISEPVDESLIELRYDWNDICMSTRPQADEGDPTETEAGGWWLWIITGRTAWSSWRYPLTATAEEKRAAIEAAHRRLVHYVNSIMDAQRVAGDAGVEVGVIGHDEPLPTWKARAK